MKTDDDQFDDEVGDLLTLHEVAELLRVPERNPALLATLQDRPQQLQDRRHVRYRRARRARLAARPTHEVTADPDVA
jgi:hypothetical protein